MSGRNERPLPWRSLMRVRISRIALADSPARVPQGEIRIVGLESLPLQAAVQDLRVGEAGRRLAVHVAERLHLPRQSRGHRAPRLDEALPEELPRHLDLALVAVR